MLFTSSKLFSPTSSTFLATGVCVGAFLYKLLPNGPLLGNYKDVYQAYKRLRPIPLSDQLRGYVDETLTAMKASEQDRTALDFFHASTADLFHAGSLHMKWGGAIGLPLTFRFTSPADVPDSGFSIQGFTIDWSSDAGRELAASLVLSPDAQRFAIAREAYTVCGSYFFGECVLIVAVLFSTFAFASLLNSTKTLRKAPRIVRVFNNLLMGLVASALWLTLNDMLRCDRDNTSDEEAARLGVGFCRGGIEFYRQMLARNSALREIIGDRNSSMISMLGDRTFLVRTPNQPLTERLAHLRQLQQEIARETELQTLRETEEKLVRQQELDALDSKTK